MNYTNEIRKDIAIEFGLEYAGYSPKPVFALTLTHCDYLIGKYGMDKGTVIVKRYMSLYGNKKVGK